ncbi:hypothetical protein [Nocardioides sp. URHA0020]|uniref:hypothetical protein n=1 Tax=Nocardioides sp. URHA0020 TaxID=1380392 RepID=UPI00048DBB8B|nr:hypothetical protein [Nocardioides sp. URHA0020]
MALDDDFPGLRRGWGWVAHLRDGGTTPWDRWSDDGAAAGRYLPGAQQLELLRRLNAAGPVDAVLARRVLEASPAGRGRLDLELAGAARPRGFGSAPVDPADLPERELLRVASALLAEDVVAAGLASPTRLPRPRPWRRRYRLVGDPMLTDPRRAALAAQGRPPGGRDARTLVLGTDVGQMLVDLWTARSLSQGVQSWRAWLDRASRADRLPARIDLARTADHWGREVGTARVHVVLDLDAVPRLTRGRGPLPGSPPLTADAVDLARRVGQVLGVLVVPEERRALLRQSLVPRLLDAPGEPLVLPARHTGWVRAHARRTTDDLLEGGYAVHGRLGSLLPIDRPGVTEPSDPGVLALALRLLLEKK